MTMALYPWLKLVHIISLTLLFGTGLGTAFYMWRAHRSGDIAIFAAVARNVVLADWLFTTPAVIIQPLSGIAMVYWLGIPITAPWVMASIVLYGVVGLFWLPVVWIQCRVAACVEELANGGDCELDHERLMRWWYRLGWPAFLSVVGIFYLMVFKPVLW